MTPPEVEEGNITRLQCMTLIILRFSLVKLCLRSPELELLCTKEKRIYECNHALKKGEICTINPELRIKNIKEHVEISVPCKCGVCKLFMNFICSIEPKYVLCAMSSRNSHVELNDPEMCICMQNMRSSSSTHRTMEYYHGLRESKALRRLANICKYSDCSHSKSSAVFHCSY